MPEAPAHVVTQILTGSAIALLVSFLGVLALTWKRQTGPLARLAPALAALTLAGAAIFISGRPAFPPARAAEWLVPAIAAIALTASLASLSKHAAVRVLVVLILSSALTYFFSRHNIRTGAWKGPAIIAWLGSATALVSLFAFSSHELRGVLTSRREVVARTLVLQFAAFALAAQSFFFGFTNGTPLAISFAAGIGGCGVAHLIRPPDERASRAFALVHSWAIASVAMVGAFTSANTDFAAAAVLLLVTPAALAPVRTDTWRGAIAASLVAATVAFASAAVPAWNTEPEQEYEYDYGSTGGEPHALHAG